MPDYGTARRGRLCFGGTFHGLGLATYQYWKRVKRPLPPFLATLTTFLFVNLGLVLFRAPSVNVAFGIAARLLPGARLGGIADLRGAIPTVMLPMLVPPLVLGSIIAFVGPTSTEIADRFRPSYRAALMIVVVILVSFTYMPRGHPE